MSLETFIARVRSYIGVGAQRDPQRFGAVVCPHGPPSAVNFMLTPNVPGNANSSCGVFGVGVLEEELASMGVVFSNEPMDTRQNWWTNAKAFAAKHGALRHPGTDDTVGVGCLVFVAIGNALHFFTTVEDLGGDRFTTVDGGQKDLQGYQMILEKTRAILDNGKVGMREVVSQKPVIEWIDVGLLLESVGRQSGGSSTAISSPPTTSAPTSAVAKGEVMAGSLEGIDVSAANGVVDFARVKAAGISFVYIRALIGRDDRDKRLEANATGCRVAGLPFGLYGLVYPRHGKPQDADVQGRQLAGIHREVGASLIPMLDCEDGPPGPPSGVEWVTATESYALGVATDEPLACGIYGSPGFFGRFPEFARSNLLARCPLWMAAYTSTMPATPKPWQKVTAWQRLGNSPGFVGHVDGCNGPVDRTTLFGGLGALCV